MGQQKEIPAEDARMEQAMGEMEREFSGMNEENPDPKQLGRMMRKMAHLTGEKIPETMDEMIRRMEKGEDPEKLESEYGDALNDEGGEGETSSETKEVGGVKARQSRRQNPLKDPTLYEMADFVRATSPLSPRAASRRKASRSD